MFCLSIMSNRYKKHIDLNLALTTLTISPLILLNSTTGPNHKQLKTKNRNQIASILLKDSQGVSPDDMLAKILSTCLKFILNSSNYISTSFFSASLLLFLLAGHNFRRLLEDRLGLRRTRRATFSVSRIHTHVINE